MSARSIPAILLALSPLPAQALCIHGGVDNARTTIAQEFAESRWVVRARVEAAEDHYSDESENWTLYRLRVVRSFKGDLPRRFTFFTPRNSGGFYMDRAWAGHDIGGEYLLFLTPFPAGPDDPAVARTATFVNYTCGQSRAWTEVSAADRRLLRRLASVR